MQRRAIAFILAALAGCSADLPAAEPIVGDRPPRNDGVPPSKPQDPTWPDGCGPSRFEHSTGACVEAPLETQTLRFDHDAAQREKEPVLFAFEDAQAIGLPGGSLLYPNQELELDVPPASFGVETVTLPLGAPAGGGATLTLRWRLSSDRWYWRATSGNVTCRISGRRLLCEFRGARFTRGVEPESADAPLSTMPAVLPDSFDTEGWVHVTH